jgi:hypothetical protein
MYVCMFRERESERERERARERESEREREREGGREGGREREKVFFSARPVAVPRTASWSRPIR